LPEVQWAIEPPEAEESTSSVAASQTLRGFALDATGDLKLEAGDLVEIDGIAYTRQKLACRFRFFLGEWFLDKREGVPFFREVFVKNPNLDVIRAVFRRVAATTPGVLSVPRFEVRFDARARVLSFDFVAICTAGKIIVSPGNDDFIVDVTRP
jgi:hypothetical protein